VVELLEVPDESDDPLPEELLSDITDEMPNPRSPKTPIDVMTAAPAPTAPSGRAGNPLAPAAAPFGAVECCIVFCCIRMSVTKGGYGAGVRATLRSPAIPATGQNNNVAVTTIAVILEPTIILPLWAILASEGSTIYLPTCAPEH